MNRITKFWHKLKNSYITNENGQFKIVTLTNGEPEAWRTTNFVGEQRKGSDKIWVGKKGRNPSISFNAPERDHLGIPKNIEKNRFYAKSTLLTLEKEGRCLLIKVFENRDEEK